MLVPLCVRISGKAKINQEITNNNLWCISAIYKSQCLIFNERNSDTIVLTIRLERTKIFNLLLLFYQGIRNFRIIILDKTLSCFRVKSKCREWTTRYTNTTTNTFGLSNNDIFI